MELDPKIQIGLNKLEDIWKKVSEVVSWKIAGYAAAAGFVGATVVSLVGAGLMFSAHDQKTSLRPQDRDTVLLEQTETLSDSDVKSVLKRNLFNREGTLGGEPESLDDEQEVISGEVIKSNLPLKLWGTIYGGDPLSGIAMVEDTRKKTTNSFLVGDRLVEDAIVKQVLKEKVIFERNGRLEYIEREKENLVRRRRGAKSSGPTAAMTSRLNKPTRATERLDSFKEEGYEFKDGKVAMTNEYKQKLITTDFSKVLQDAKAEPNMVEGQLQGFKLTRIRSPSIYEKAGLANGDIVTEINGVELSSASQAIRTLQSLRSANQIEVTVIQGGVKRTLEISIGQ